MCKTLKPSSEINMKMEVIAVQQQYQQSQYGVLGTNKVRDWTSTLQLNDSNNNNSIVTQNGKAVSSLPPYMQNNTTNKIKNSINKKTNRQVEVVSNKSRNNSTASNSSSSSSSSSNNSPSTSSSNSNTYTTSCYTPLFHSDDSIDVDSVKELSSRLLDELRAAKSRHLTCTEVSLPCDLTPRIAEEIIRVSSKEPCGIRGCTIYIEFEDEPNNSRRIASLKLDDETVSSFEVYLTLRQDHRGWIALLPQFMKSLARTITISPEFTITKHKLYSPLSDVSRFSYGRTSSAAISTPSS